MMWPAAARPAGANASQRFWGGSLSLLCEWPAAARPAGANASQRLGGFPFPIVRVACGRAPCGRQRFAEVGGVPFPYCASGLRPRALRAPTLRRGLGGFPFSSGRCGSGVEIRAAFTRIFLNIIVSLLHEWSNCCKRILHMNIIKKLLSGENNAYRMARESDWPAFVDLSGMNRVSHLSSCVG